VNDLLKVSIFYKCTNRVRVALPCKRPVFQGGFASIPQPIGCDNEKVSRDVRQLYPHCLYGSIAFIFTIEHNSKKTINIWVQLKTIV